MTGQFHVCGHHLCRISLRYLQARAVKQLLQRQKQVRGKGVYTETQMFLPPHAKRCEGINSFTSHGNDLRVATLFAAFCKEEISGTQKVSRGIRSHRK